MWILSWIVYPAMNVGLAPVGPGLLRMKLLVLGIVWQAVPAIVILYRREGNIRLGKISRRSIAAWELLALYSLSALFNTFLGEESIFRGVLLPKMEGVFGKWHRMANGVVFSFYHLRQSRGILETLPGDVVIAYSGRRFRSQWFPIIIHSGMNVFFLFLIRGLILKLT